MTFNRKIFGSLVIYGVCVWISIGYCTKYWVVGPVFGICYLMVHLRELKKEFWLKYALFLAASTLTYAAVYGMADKGYNLPWGPQRGYQFKSDFWESLFGPLSAAVVFGSLLLPLLHRRIFSTSFKTTAKVWLWLIASWYVLVLISDIYDGLSSDSFNFMTVGIALWQGLYMKMMRLNSSSTQH